MITLEEYTRQHAPYTVEYNLDNGGWDVLFHGEWLETAANYAEADDIISAHIAGCAAIAQAYAEWQEERL